MKPIRVFCPVCKDGKNTIWEGSIHEWGKELEKEDPPDWANYAHRHEKAHDHKIMVEYPSGLTVPFQLSSSKETIEEAAKKLRDWLIADECL